MADKEKAKPPQPKHIPKDGQVIMAIMKEMGITEYDPKTIVQLTEFVYRYATSIMEEARTYANNSKKKLIDLDDVRLALQLTSESSFTTPPPREVLLELAHNKNYLMLPTVKPHCGLRLPPDRYCLSSPNYTVKSGQKKPTGGKSNYGISGGPGTKMATKSNISYVKRTGPAVAKQVVAIPKPTKVNVQPQQQQQKTVLKPKIQITQNVQIAPAITNSGGGGMEFENSSLKRKRDDDDDDGVEMV